MDTKSYMMYLQETKCCIRNLVEKEDIMRKISLFGLVTVVLIVIIVFLTAGTVLSQSLHGYEMDEAGYRKMEREYISRVRTYLDEQGYHNSGVTLTHTTEADGYRTYTLKLHHKKLYKLDETEKEELLDYLGSLQFDLENGEFYQEFLMADSR